MVVVASVGEDTFHSGVVVGSSGAGLSVTATDGGDVSVGPWDADGLGLVRSLGGVHSLWRTLSTVSMDIPVPPGALVGVEKVDGGLVGAIHLSLPSSSTVVVTITDGAPQSRVRDRIAAGPSAADVGRLVIDSPVGEVVRVSTLAGDVLVWGGNGPRWSMKAVLFGTSVSEDDVDIFYTVISDSIVFRGERPCTPGMPLDLSVIEVR